MTSIGGKPKEAGEGTFGVCVNTSPANFQVGTVGFEPSWTAEDLMDSSIIRLEQELQEANARIAVLEEEQKILVKRFDARLHAMGKTAEAKAAVTEGGAGNSGAERPEPPPQFSETPETDANLLDSDCRDNCPHTFQYSSDQRSPAVDIAVGNYGLVVLASFARKLERERDEARAHRDLAVACYDELYTELCGVSAERYELMERHRRTKQECDEAREVLREIQAAEWKTSGELRGMARTALEAAK